MVSAVDASAPGDDRLSAHRRRLAAWLAVIGVIASLAYWARFTVSGRAQPDVLFRWSLATETLVLDGALLALMLLIARGLPKRHAFALRPPSSWREAGRIALVALAATWATSLALEITIGHGSREQAVPSYWDAARVAPFIVNAVAVGLFVPFVEEAMCRGIGFLLLQPFGQAAAIVGSALAFALAHGAVADLPWVLVTGIGLGYLRARTGSLYPCVALHATINGIAVLASALVGAGVVTS